MVSLDSLRLQYRGQQYSGTIHLLYSLDVSAIFAHKSVSVYVRQFRSCSNNAVGLA